MMKLIANLEVSTQRQQRQTFTTLLNMTNSITKVEKKAQEVTLMIQKLNDQQADRFTDMKVDQNILLNKLQLIEHEIRNHLTLLTTITIYMQSLDAVIKLLHKKNLEHIRTNKRLKFTKKLNL